MKKITLLLLLGFTFTLVGFSQNSYLKNRWNIKAAYSRFPNGIERMMANGSREMQKTGHYRISATHGVLNFIEAGGYFGYSQYETKSLTSDSSSFVHENAYGLFYGIQANLQLFPIFVSETDFRFDIYLTTKLGGKYYRSPKGSIVATNNSLDFFIGPGFVFYLSKHIGAFIETGYYKTDISKEWANLRYGLSVKF